MAAIKCEWAQLAECLSCTHTHSCAKFFVSEDAIRMYTGQPSHTHLCEDWRQQGYTQTHISNIHPKNINSYVEIYCLSHNAAVSTHTQTHSQSLNTWSHSKCTHRHTFQAPIQNSYAGTYCLSHAIINTYTHTHPHWAYTHLKKNQSCKS